MSDDFGKFTAPKPSEELHQGSEVPVTFSIDPNDRMPVPASPDNEDRPPPLAVDTLVCMEDKSSFVIRNPDGSVWVVFEPSEVKRSAGGSHYVEPKALMRSVNANRKISTSLGWSGFVARIRSVLNLPRLYHVAVAGEKTLVIAVEPLRPACAHYARMQTDISADRSRRYLMRSCMAQRSETGEYYSVGDSAIYACSLRSPRHIESERILDDFDQLKVQQANEKIQAGLFDVDAALAAEDSSGSLGVLGSNPKG